MSKRPQWAHAGPSGPSTTPTRGHEDNNDDDAGWSSGYDEIEASPHDITLEEATAGSLTCVAVKQALDSVFGSGAVRDGVLSVGVKARTGPGLTRDTMAFPNMALLLSRFFSKTCDGTFTTIQVNLNKKKEPHLDSSNHGPSYIAAIGPFVGGELYIDRRGEVDVHASDSLPWSWTVLEAATTLHATCDWSDGDRYAIIVYTNGVYTTASSPTTGHG